jgi:hypothetical protein
MSCPVCQKNTSNNNVFCSPNCARLFVSVNAKLFIAALGEANYDANAVPRNEVPRNEVPRYEVPRNEVPRREVRQSYQDLLKQRQAAKSAISQESSQEKSQEDSEVDDGKCKKCKINPRNDGHPICTDCYKAMKDKPVQEKKVVHVKKDKSKYNKKAK